MLHIVKLNTTQTNPEMSKTIKTKELMLAFRNEETFQPVLKGYYTHHQSSIFKYKAILLKVKQSHKPVQ